MRPTNPAFTPDEAEKSLSGDTAKLYRLIWSRFIASQMSDCQMDTVNASITAGDYLFKASGFVVTFDGFSVLYEEASDDKEKKETALPPLEQGQTLRLRELKHEQKFTQPPAATPKLPSSRPWRRTASAVPPPTPPSSPPSSTGIMWSGRPKSSSPPPWAGPSTS